MDTEEEKAEKQLKEYFDNHSDCYADTWSKDNYGNMVEGVVVPAMTKETAIKFVLSESQNKDIDPQFWVRLESFVKDVQTGCCAGEEEKEMILATCNRMASKK